MDDTSFLDSFGEPGASNATLRVVLADGQVHHISDRICPFEFLDTCPLLYHAFEFGAFGRFQASIEAPSQSAVISLVRYCYTGSYLPFGPDNGPITLLPHAEMYKMAEDYDMPELQLLAHGNFSCQVDFACCLPDPPRDLLGAIRFLYQQCSDHQSRQQHGLISTLLNYCISVFLYHKLGGSEEFLKVVSDIPEFRQDLCRTNMKRNFEDDCAFDIIRLSLDTLQVQPSYRPTLLASRDLPEEMLIERPPDAPEEPQPNAICHLAVIQEAPDFLNKDSASDSNTLTCVHRPKISPQDTTMECEVDSSSDEEGFALVHRSKAPAPATPDEPMSSPEIIPSKPIDILAATGSDYSDDDEWTML